MATFKYPPTGSLHTTADGVHAFDLDSSGADVLILGAGYFFIAEGLGAGGAVLGNTGAWTVTVNGSIVSKQTAGLWLLGGNTAVSTLTIGTEGSVGGTAGVTLDSSAVLKNAGEINGTQYGIHIRGAGARTIVNSGTIAGVTRAIYDEDGLSNDAVSNSGTIIGTINLGGGNNKLTNWGTIEFFTSGDGNDTFINFKKVGTKVVSGTITSGVILGEGDDRFLGGNRGESVGDDSGADTYKLGGGNDRFSRNDPLSAVTEETDQVDGGKGIDLYFASHFVAVYINLDTNGHSDTVFMPAQTAINSLGIDRITGFENATGGESEDVIFGSATNNVLEGGNGNDRLFGLAGNDTLNGGSGIDVLNGGRGRDILDGGAGASDDTFVFTSIKDSGVTKATRDTIIDFEEPDEIIDLSAIDANANTAADDAFVFLGTNVNFNGQAGALRAYWNSKGQIVEGDVNGDSLGDFSIQIIDPNHSIEFKDFYFDL